MELLPCPFCGAADKDLRVTKDEYGFFVRCLHCCVETDHHAVIKKAIATWNSRASPASAPYYKVADRGFRWDSENQQHIPQLLIEFTPVPANAPNYSKGWEDRDKLAAMLAAAPIPPVSEDRKDAERLNWLDEQGMIAIGHKGCGEYRYYAGDLFPAIRQVIDQAMQENKP